MLLPRRTLIKGFASLPLFGLLGCEQAPPKLYPFSSRALGIDISMTFAAKSESAAQTGFDNALTLISRLETIFSLYDPESEISRLNRDGVIQTPSAELTELIKRSQQVHFKTIGLFDISVQPLWKLYSVDPRPSQENLNAALSLIDSTAIVATPEKVKFSKPNMAITLNGCAQGFITDQVARQLEQSGISAALVNIGEFTAFGKKPDGEPWQVGIQNPGNILDTIAVETLHNASLATSAGYGGLFTDDGDSTHIFNPKIGAQPSRYQSVSVIAANGFAADAYATAFLLMDEMNIRRIKSETPEIQTVILVNSDNTISRF